MIDQQLWIMILKYIKDHNLDYENLSEQLLRTKLLSLPCDFNGNDSGTLEDLFKRTPTLPPSKPSVKSLTQRYSKLFSTQLHALPIFSITFDRTGTRLITGSDDNLCKILAHGMLQHSLKAPSVDGVIDLFVSTENDFFITATSDKTIRIYSLNGDLMGTICVGKEIVNAIISPSGQLIVATCGDGRARVYIRNGSNFYPEPIILEAGTLTKDKVQSVSFSDSGNRMIFGGDDGNVYMYSVKSLLINEFIEAQAEVVEERGLTKVQFVASSPSPCFVFEDHRAPINDVTFNHSGDRIVSGCVGGYLYSYKFDFLLNRIEKKQYCINTYTQYIPFTGEPEPSRSVTNPSGDEILAVVFNCSDSRIITTSTNQTIQVWTPDLELLLTIEGHSGQISFLETHPTEERFVLTGDLDGNVKIHDIFTGKLIWSEVIGVSVVSGSYHPNGSELVVGDLKGSIHSYGINNQDYAGIPSEQFLLSDWGVEDEKDELVSAQRVPYPDEIQQARKLASSYIVDNNYLLDRSIASYLNAQQELDWSLLDDRTQELDKKHMKKRRNTMNIEPLASERGPGVHFIEAPNDLFGPIPDSSGDEYEGEVDENDGDIEMDQEETIEHAELGSEDDEFVVEGVAHGRNRFRNRRRNYPLPESVSRGNYLTRSVTEESGLESLTDEEIEQESRKRELDDEDDEFESWNSDVENQIEGDNRRSGSRKRLRVKRVNRAREIVGLDSVSSEEYDPNDILPVPAPPAEPIRTKLEHWLTAKNPQHTYLPQLDDLVIYCVNGHQDLAKTSEYPLIVNDTETRELILGKVKSIKYIVSGKFIVCQIKLACYADLNEIGPTRNKDIELVALDESFIGLFEDYMWSLEKKFNAGDKCLIRRNGNIINVAILDVGESWWHKYHVIDGEGNEYKVTPWDICKIDEEFPTYSSLEENDSLRIKNVIDEVKSNEILKPFLNEVVYEEFPLYLDLVPYPIYVDLIGDRVENNYYRTTKQVVFEWDLMCKNVIGFNQRGSEICKLCKSELAPYKNLIKDPPIKKAEEIQYEDPFEDFQEDLVEESSDEDFEAEIDDDEDEEIVEIPESPPQKNMRNGSRSYQKRNTKSNIHSSEEITTTESDSDRNPLRSKSAIVKKLSLRKLNTRSSSRSSKQKDSKNQSRIFVESEESLSDSNRYPLQSKRISPKRNSGTIKQEIKNDYSDDSQPNSEHESVERKLRARKPKMERRQSARNKIKKARFAVYSSDEELWN